MIGNLVIAGSGHDEAIQSCRDILDCRAQLGRARNDGLDLQ